MRLGGRSQVEREPELGEPPTEIAKTGGEEEHYVEFWPAGTVARGWFVCTGCLNTVTVHHVLPRCLVCGGRLWERLT